MTPAVSRFVTYRWAADSDLPAIQELLQNHWEKNHIFTRDGELFRWQYPVRGSSRMPVLLALDGEKLVGMLGVIPFRFSYKGKETAGGWLTMWLAMQEYRPQRLGLGLLHRVMDEFPMTGTLGGTPTTMRALGTLRYTVVHALPRWVRVIDPVAVNALLETHPEVYPLDIRRQLVTAAEEPAKAPPNVRIVDWQGGLEGWDAAWAKRFAPNLASVARDSQYLNWRYVSHPRFSYHVRFAEEGGELMGMAVYRLQAIRDREERVLRIVEFLGEGEAGRALASHVLSAAKFAGAAFADFYCTSGRWSHALETSGFTRERTDLPQLPALFQPLDCHPRPLNAAFYLRPGALCSEYPFAELDLTYFTRSDCDQDRPN